MILEGVLEDLHSLWDTLMFWMALLVVNTEDCCLCKDWLRLYIYVGASCAGIFITFY